jgi:MerR family transcriptional regulator, thiopeptide resistance regulator
MGEDGRYTVSQLATISGVSIRTLHHYDEIGLLKPAAIGANGYRYYGRDELLRLQQIMFHRELGFALNEIRRVLDAPDFDRTEALRTHRSRLESDIRRQRQLLRTINQTLAALQHQAPMEDTAMYKGFDAEKQAAHERELVERYGPGMQGRLDQARAGRAGWSQADHDAVQAEQAAIEEGMASALTSGLPADSAEVTALMRRHHAWVARQWNREVPAHAFAGLAAMYEADDRFRAHYDTRTPGLAEYMILAMTLFAEQQLG